MSQEFYVKEILPKHIKEIKAVKERLRHRVYLQEEMGKVSIKI